MAAAMGAAALALVLLVVLVLAGRGVRAEQNAIVYLVYGADPKYSEQLPSSLYSIGRHWLDRYPEAAARITVVVFHERDRYFTQARERARLRWVLNGGRPERAYRMRFVPIDIGFPAWFDAEGHDRERYVMECPPYPPFKIGYLQMNRFFMWQMFTHAALEPYTYYNRIDTDTGLHEPLAFEPFSRARERNLTFALWKVRSDPPCVTRGMDTAIADWLRLRGIRRQRHVQISTTYAGCYGLGRLAFWRSEPVTALGQFLNEERRGVFEHRWSDQVFYAQAMAIWWPESAVEAWDTKLPLMNHLTRHGHVLDADKFAVTALDERFNATYRGADGEELRRHAAADKDEL